MNDTSIEQLRSLFEKESGLVGLASELKARPDGELLILNVANPTERLYNILEGCIARIQEETGIEVRATLKKRAPANLLQSSEGRLLLRTLSESLNINRNSFEKDFFTRYTKSVSGAEEQIIANANNIVFGRRGAGKSSLLLYGWHMRKKSESPSAWVDMQVFSRRNDIGIAVDVFLDVLEQLRTFSGTSLMDVVIAELNAIRNHESISEDALRKLLPTIRTVFSAISQSEKNIFIFLDDYHVINKNIQPMILDLIYAVTRGNRTYLKISSIETLTESYDSKTRNGMQIPNDLQAIKLDYNLTIPEKATQHITSILDAHAIYCGLTSINSLCTSSDVLTRLVWVSAGVPRDALSIFSQAMTKASLSNSKRVSVSSVNIAASETVSIKLRELDVDAASEEVSDLTGTFEAIRTFAMKKHKQNAFLVEITNDSNTYKQVLKLIDLRLIHVISEGMTVGEAGVKYLGLILDYGFYIGIRAARSVKLFNKQSKQVVRQDMRKLPIFTGA